MAKTQVSAKKLNIPNILTFLRFFLVPFILYFYIDGEFRLAFWLFCLAGLSDFLDGLIAKRWGRKTPLGAWLDPAADKFLMASSYVTLAAIGSLPWWLTATVFLRDFVIVMGLWTLHIRRQKINIRPTYLSKFNTFLQLLTLFVVFFLATLGNSAPDVLLTALPYIFYLTGGMTILSGLEYILIGIKINRGSMQSADLPIKKS